MMSAIFAVAIPPLSSVGQFSCSEPAVGRKNRETQAVPLKFRKNAGAFIIGPLFPAMLLARNSRRKFRCKRSSNMRMLFRGQAGAILVVWTYLLGLGGL